MAGLIVTGAFGLLAVTVPALFALGSRPRRQLSLLQSELDFLDQLPDNFIHRDRFAMTLAHNINRYAGLRHTTIRQSESQRRWIILTVVSFALSMGGFLIGRQRFSAEEDWYDHSNPERVFLVVYMAVLLFTLFAYVKALNLVWLRQKSRWQRRLADKRAAKRAHGSQTGVPSVRHDGDEAAQDE